MDAMTRYRNLATLPEKDWIDLDIHLYILANYQRYSASLMRRIGLKYLPSDTQDILPGLFCDVAYRPLHKLHQANLDASGERRNQLMLGTLKMIAATRMVEAVIKEFPSYTSLDDEDNDITVVDQGDTPYAMPSTGIMQAAEPMPQYEVAFNTSHLPGYDGAATINEAEQEFQQQDERISTMIEILRSRLTQTQYRHLRMVLCEQLSYQDIADRTGHTINNVRSVLTNARRRLYEMVPEQSKPELQWITGVEWNG
jgi:hypothetical protein